MLLFKKLFCLNLENCSSCLSKGFLFFPTTKLINTKIIYSSIVKMTHLRFSTLNPIILLAFYLWIYING